MRRRELLALIGGAATLPLAARAQQRKPVRRIGVIMNYAEHDAEGEARVSALRGRLQELGWAEGNNVRIEVRWAAGKTDHMQAYAAELVRLPADVIVANSTPLLARLKPLTHTIPMCSSRLPIRSAAALSAIMPDQAKISPALPISNMKTRIFASV